MPLVTLTCSKKWYPTKLRSRIFRRPRLTVELATNLPLLFAQNDDKLHFEPPTETGLPGDAVQVDIKRFHANSKNSVDVWIHLQLTEHETNTMHRLDLRDHLITIFEQWFDVHHTELSWALDIFWGPGHGCFTNQTGHVVQLW